MAMERVRSSIAALLFLTLLFAAASASASAGGDDAAAAVEEKHKQCHPKADEPYMLVAFHNKDGEEIRLLADQRPKVVPGVSAFANRSGHWFYTGTGEDKQGKGKRRRLFPLPQHQQSNNRSSRGGGGGGRRTAEGLWNTLGVLVNATATSSGGDPAAAHDDDDEGYVLVGMQTGGGDKIRLVVVADQRYFFITGFAQGFFWSPRWSFRDGERHRLLPSLGGNGSSHGGGGSHAEVVAYNVLAALKDAGSSCG